MGGRRMLSPGTMETPKTENDLGPEEKPPQSKDIWDFDPNDYFGKIFNRIRGKISLGNRTGGLINKIGPRRIIIVLAFAWISLVACGAWGNYETDWYMHRTGGGKVLFSESEYDFDTTMMVSGFLGSFLILIGILVMQFKFVKSKLVAWILGATPIIAILVFVSGPAMDDSVWDDTTTGLQIGKFIGYMAFAVMMDYILLILPFIMAARAVIGGIRTILRSLLGLRG